jgi:hypothetical protein
MNNAPSVAVGPSLSSGSCVQSVSQTVQARTQEVTVEPNKPTIAIDSLSKRSVLPSSAVVTSK